MKIDFVGLRDDGLVDLGECKWGTVRSATALHAELERRAARYPTPHGATVARRFFVRHEPKGKRTSGTWHDLDDL